jgi:malonyl-CoA O-methyltransferase
VSGEKVRPGSFAHGIGEFVTSALRAGLVVEGLSEHAPDAAFAAAYPRAEKYVGWPMLVVLQLRA